MSDVIFILLLIGAGQGIFVFLLLLLTKGRFPNLFLALIFLAFSLQLVDIAMLFSKNILNYPAVAFLGVPMNLAFGPLIYAYIKHNRSNADSFKITELIHFIPATLHLIYLIVVYYSMPVAVQVDFLQSLIDQLARGPSTVNFGALVFPSVLYIQFGTYVYVSRRIIDHPKHFDSGMSKWLKRIWWGTLAIGLFGFLQTLMVVLEVRQQPVTGYIASAMVLTYIYYGSLIVFRRSPVLYGKAFTKYYYSTLDDNQLDEMVERVNTIMLRDKPYLDPTMSLSKLSQVLEIPERHLSQVINGHLNQHFNEFLNVFRVEEMKSEMLNPKNDALSLLGIAMKCGFNSKSTFQSAFKKATGDTPSAYKNNIQKNRSENMY